MAAKEIQSILSSERGARPDYRRSNRNERPARHEKQSVHQDARLREETYTRYFKQQTRGWHQIR